MIFSNLNMSYNDSIVAYMCHFLGDGLYNLKYRKGQHKESKEARRARNKVSKINKFDPSKRESTREEKIRFEKEQHEIEMDGSDDDDDDDNESDDMDHIQDNHEEEMEDLSSSSNNNSTTTTNSVPNLSQIEQLRAKLRAKIAEKRSQRPGGDSDIMVSKRAARRAEKKRKMDLAKKKQQQQQYQSGGKTHTGKTSNKITFVNNQDLDTLGGSKIQNPNEESNIGNDLSGIDFGGIAGLKQDLSVSGNYSEANKSLKNKGKKKSLEKLLAAAEAKKERLRQLKESDDLEDKEKAKKMQWGDTLKAAR